MARSASAHASLEPTTFHGAVKLRAHERDVSLAALGEFIGLKPDSVRARLCISRGKRALQPWQVTRIAEVLDMDVVELHRLAARHEGWRV